jgi:uncharacterized protein
MVVVMAAVMAVIDWRRRTAFSAFAVVLAAVLAATAALAFSTPERKGWVTDEAGILDPETAAAISAKLSALQSKTGYEVVVVTLGSLEGASIETWGNALGESWGVGRSGSGPNDTGALLIVAPNDRKVRIAVGYGLGNRLSDSTAAAIIADHILPYFRQGNFARGVRAGVDSIILELDRPGAGSTDVERSAAPVSFKKPSFWQWLTYKLTPNREIRTALFWLVIGILVVIVIMWAFNSGWGYGGRRRYYDDGWGSSSSGGGGFSSGGGSWGGGGGGSSGGGSFGGGATGSW